MPRNPVRRAQLIAPFGVGAMFVTRNGTGVITAGLDHWYEREDSQNEEKPDTLEFQIEEPRLRKRLGVDHFRLPPDFRTKRWGATVPNTGLTVPTLRFPQWHFCPRCRRLEPQSLILRTGRVECEECKAQNKKVRMVQVPFVAMCDHGHIQDFPWREWVHRSPNPTCSGKLRLRSTGGASLAAQVVSCDCGLERTLAGITEESDGTTTLSKTLTDDEREFLCEGHMPWLGIEDGSSCGEQLRGSLRSASNVYFAAVRNAIYLPRGTSLIPSELVSILEEPHPSLVLQIKGVDTTRQDLERFVGKRLEPFSDEQIAAAVNVVVTGEGDGSDDSAQRFESDDEETAFRRAEFDILRAPRRDEQLVITTEGRASYDGIVRRCFSEIMLVKKLRETRALAGFSRIYPEDGKPDLERQSMLWRSMPHAGKRWLPAYIVFGEGIFLEFDETLLAEWEQRPEVRRRVKPLQTRYHNVSEDRRLRDREITSRFLLIHTFAHLLINQLTFECGYSSASLRERLYVSSDNDAPMAGLLIYTAAGDAEGTLGGLVRMGRPEYLGPAIERALESALWCSADPVCMDMGDHGGQGPDSCNLAACHNCALVPETACEEFNRFLDRGVVVGTIEDRSLGFFSQP